MDYFISYFSKFSSRCPCARKINNDDDDDDDY